MGTNKELKSVRDIFRSYAVLDENGRHINGTDKESNHRYGDAYEIILSGLRYSAQLVMEIGNADGSSLLAWSEVFPNANVVGFDIHPIANRNDRIEFNLGDASNYDDCQRAARGREFDFICEDASHTLADCLTTLLYMWPYVKPETGIYVIEEFYNIGQLRYHIGELLPYAEIYDTAGPFGGDEPLVVLRKPKHRNISC